MSYLYGNLVLETASSPTNRRSDRPHGIHHIAVRQIMTNLHRPAPGIRRTP
jgi:hypothetical protein